MNPTRRLKRPILFLILLFLVTGALSWGEEKHCKKMEPHYVAEDDLPLNLICPNNNATVMITKEQSDILSGKKVYKFYASLVTDCFLKNDTEKPVGLLENAYCPRIFDGFACWEETMASTTVYQPCPGYIVGFDTRRLAHKTCTEKGTWYTHPETGKPWTNYTDCVDLVDLSFRGAVNILSIIGYVLSIPSLAVSLFIFMYFSALDCTRVRVHKHLFAAILGDNTLWVTWYVTVVNEPLVVQNNEYWCQVLHVAKILFTVATYIWMFCESLHLYLALVVVFVPNSIIINYMGVIGWGSAACLTMVYAAVRIYVYQDTDRCWIDNSDATLIITIPVVTMLLLSLAFVINIIRVLYMKVHPGARNNTEALMKALRAALFLMPLFGLQYLLMLFRPPPGTPEEIPYEIVTAFCTSMQGFAVSTMFCLTNTEVKNTVKTHFAIRSRRRNEMLALTAATGGESKAHTRDRHTTEIREDCV